MQFTAKLKLHSRFTEIVTLNHIVSKSQVKKVKKSHFSLEDGNSRLTKRASIALEVQFLLSRKKNEK